MARKGTGNGGQSIILRREEAAAHGHHGDAWKVAYADFVTVMMAFFLLMWLLNATTEAQRKGLADYFSPRNAISRGFSGTGQPFGGRTPHDQGNPTSNLGAAEVLAGHADPVPDLQQMTEAPSTGAIAGGWRIHSRRRHGRCARRAAGATSHELRAGAFRRRPRWRRASSARSGSWRPCRHRRRSRPHRARTRHTGTGRHGTGLHRATQGRRSGTGASGLREGGAVDPRCPARRSIARRPRRN
jgi:Membrane MotB of proton-channel complex MotA/MotB